MPKDLLSAKLQQPEPSSDEWLDRVKRFEVLDQTLGVPTTPRYLYEQAFTHPSIVNEMQIRGVQDCSRLAWLGARVLKALTITEFASSVALDHASKLHEMAKHPLSVETRASVFKRLSLHELVLCGKGETLEPDRTKAPFVEAMFGALFAAHGLGITQKAFGKLFGSFLEEARSPGVLRADPKSALQEITQGLYKATPVYEVMDRRGSDHATTFRVRVLVQGKAIGEGEGSSKKRAGEQAALDALSRLPDHLKQLAIRTDSVAASRQPEQKTHRRLQASRVATLQELARYLSLSESALPALDDALTHASWLNENYAPGVKHGRLLAYIGVPLWELYVGDYLFKREEVSIELIRGYETQLHPLRETVFDEMGWEKLYRIGKGQILGGGAPRGVKLDVISSLAYAAYADGGYTKVKASLDRLFTAHFERVLTQDTEALRDDSKSDFQALTQEFEKQHPEYRLAAEHGPEHAKLYEVEAIFRGEVYGTGQGRTKQEAEMEAAHVGLRRYRQERLPDEMLRRARQYLHAGDERQAILALNTVLETQADNYLASVELGKLYLARKQYEDAKEALQRAISIDAGHPESWGLFGDAHQGLGQYQKAIECYIAALQLAPAQETWLLRLTSVRERQHQTELFRDQLIRVKALIEQEQWVKAARACALLLPQASDIASPTRQQFESTLNKLLEGIQGQQQSVARTKKRRTELVDAILDIADYYLADGRLGQASRLCQLAQTVGATDYRLLRLQGILAREGGDVGTSIKYLLEAVSHSRDDAPINLELGTSYLALGRERGLLKAWDAFETARKDKRYWAQATVGLARTYCALRETNEATKLLSEALAQDKRNPELLRGLTLIYKEKKLYSPLCDLLTGLRGELDEHLDLRCDLAWALYGLGKYRPAIGLLRRMASTSEDPAIHRLLYQCYLATHNKKQAIIELERILSLDPNGPEALADMYLQYYTLGKRWELEQAIDFDFEHTLRNMRNIEQKVAVVGRALVQQLSLQSLIEGKEIRTVVASIRQLADEIDNASLQGIQPPDDGTIKTALDERCASAVQLCVRLMRSVSAAYRVHAEASDLGEIVQGVTRLFQRRFERQGKKLVFDLEPNLPMCILDRDLLNDAVYELLSYSLSRASISKPVQVRISRDIGRYYLNLQIFLTLAEHSDATAIQNSLLALVLQRVAISLRGYVTVSMEGKDQKFTLRLPTLDAKDQFDRADDLVGIFLDDAARYDVDTVALEQAIEMALADCGNLDRATLVRESLLSLIQNSQAERWGEFEGLGSLFHGMKNYFQFASGFSEALSHESAQDKRIKLFRQIQQQAVQARKILDNLTSFFGLFEEPQWAFENLNRLVGNALQQIEGLQLERQIQLMCHLDPTLPSGRVDPALVQSAILNLMKNSVEAMPNGGELTVETRYLSDAHRAEITISDNGTGIAPQAIPNLFTSFRSSKEGSTGTGIGLPTVKRIVDIHRGSIVVRSELGKGTTFTLNFLL